MKNSQAMHVIGLMPEVDDSDEEFEENRYDAWKKISEQNEGKNEAEAMKESNASKENNKIDIKVRAKYYRSLYGLEREEMNFNTKFKRTFDDLAATLNLPQVFEFWKDEFLDKIMEYKKEPDINPEYNPQPMESSSEVMSPRRKRANLQTAPEIVKQEKLRWKASLPREARAQKRNVRSAAGLPIRRTARKSVRDRRRVKNTVTDSKLPFGPIRTERAKFLRSLSPQERVKPMSILI